MNETILVCDDDEKIVEAIEIYLLQEGYRVLKAYDGEQCLKLLDVETVHLVVLDIMMPKLDGMSTAYKMRQKYNVPIIMLSAKSESTDEIARLSFGADVANEARNEIYHNIDKYNTNEPLYIELAEEPTVKSYYLKHFFLQTGYRVNSSDTTYLGEYEEQNIELRNKIGTKDVAFLSLKICLKQSLVEIQQGSLAIEIDGDLFKVSAELVASYENENRSCEMDSLPLQ
ncbi:MAG: response regulator [Niameybacter sp.]|uniref:response regulator n=1 Tax=Niameybacter sp. TaxID=2033640 RepID=UPI002FC5FF06